MSGRKNKNRQRRQQREQSTELLTELNSLRDLLGSEELGDIPLLDQVAEPAPGEPPTQSDNTAPPRRQRAQEPQPPQQAPRPPGQAPLDESDLPILFSPVDEEPPEVPPELDESDRKLLRPLQDLPPEANSPGVPAEHEPEQQGELFGEPERAPTPAENPFLPAHIRARLTGGRMPKPETEAEAPQTTEAPELSQAEAEADAAEAPAADEVAQEAAGATEASAPPAPDSADTAPAERQRQRQQLIDRLVAQQLPELERQLRARIERMVDELEANR